jgi:hypothetical protein
MGAKQSLIILCIALLAACSGGSKSGGAEQAAATTHGAAGDDAGDKGGGKADEHAAATTHGAAGDDAGDKGGGKADEHKDNNEVVLSADEVGKLGITTTAAQAVTYTPGAQGFGVILSHDTIAQVAADLQTATAAAQQSEAVLARGKRLASGPGALGTDAVETATRQVAADQAALELARRKLTATLGQEFPRLRGGATTSLLDDLANGTVKLARVTFPPGVLGSARPQSLRVTTLDSGPAVAAWTTSELWDAPQDPTLPGRSLFALLRAPQAVEGAHLQALAVSAAGGTAGVLIPTAAVVVSDGQAWCYVQKKAGTFERTPIETNRPLPDGYFASSWVSPGDPLVTSAAGLLLARQTNPSTEAPD